MTPTGSNKTSKEKSFMESDLESPSLLRSNDEKDGEDGGQWVDVGMRDK